MGAFKRLSTLEEYDEGDDWKKDHFYSTDDDASTIQEELIVSTSFAQRALKSDLNYSSHSYNFLRQRLTKERKH